jgi:hypothetical protein
MEESKVAARVSLARNNRMEIRHNIMLKVDRGLLSNKILYWNLQFSSIDFYSARYVKIGYNWL